jgi:hypothetical protein
LAREAARDDIHQSTPRLAIEGSDIIPDWERWQVSFVLPLHESLSAPFIDFDGTDGFPSEEFSAKYAATIAREKCQFIHFIESLIRVLTKRCCECAVTPWVNSDVGWSRIAELIR